MTRRGASLLELVVAMAVMGVFLLVLAGVASEYRRADREIRFGWSIHPDDMAVLARMRRDVLDSAGYPEAFNGRVQAPDYLILTTASGRTVTWELGAERVTRTAWSGSGSTEGEWVANATPRFEVDAWDLPDGATAVRLIGRAGKGVVVDRIFAPRAE